MLVVSTPETINPVADACEAAGVPCLSTVMPWEAWYFGRGAKPGAALAVQVDLSLRLWSGGIPQGLCFAMGPASDKQESGRPLSERRGRERDPRNLAPALAKDGFTIIDPGPYEDGTTDYSAQIAKFKAEKCEIFNTFPIPPDFAAFWRQAAQQGYTKTVKIAQIAKTGLFPDGVRRSAISDTIFRAPLIGTRPSLTSRPLPAWAARNSPTAMRKPRVSSGHSSSARRCPCSTQDSTLSRPAGSGEQSGGRQGALDSQDDDNRRQGRFHQRPGAQRFAGTDHRNTMGQGACRDRNSSSTMS